MEFVKRTARMDHLSKVLWMIHDEAPIVAQWEECKHYSSLLIQDLFMDMFVRDIETAPTDTST